jgi:hypothetical protein
MDVVRPEIEKERVWRAPPTLDAKASLVYESGGFMFSVVFIFYILLTESSIEIMFFLSLLSQAGSFYHSQISSGCHGRYPTCDKS